MAPTTTIETVTVVRPLKILALVCACLAILLLIICCSSTYWLFSASYHQGLWAECREVDQPDGSRQWICNSNEGAGYITACAAFVVICILVVAVSAGLNGGGLCMRPENKLKFTFYRIAMYAYFATILVLLIGLITFTVGFMQEIHEREDGDSQWYFGWSYGLAWAALIFLVGSGILLLIDKESDEILYREKTYYYNNNGATTT